MAHASLPSASTMSLANLDVRPGVGLRVLLVADLARSVAQALGALLVPRLIQRSDSFFADDPVWLQVAGSLLGLPYGLGRADAGPAWLPWGLCALGVFSAVATLGCFALRPKAMTWRRRLALLAVAEVLFLGVGNALRGVFVTLWAGAIWVGLLVGGLALSREVARITGEEGLEADPSHPRL